MSDASIQPITSKLRSSFSAGSSSVASNVSSQPQQQFASTDIALTQPVLTQDPQVISGPVVQPQVDQPQSDLVAADFSTDQLQDQETTVTPSGLDLDAPQEVPEVQDSTDAVSEQTSSPQDEQLVDQQSDQFPPVPSETQAYQAHEHNQLDQEAGVSAPLVSAELSDDSDLDLLDSVMTEVEQSKTSGSNAADQAVVSLLQADAQQAGQVSRSATKESAPLVSEELAPELSGYLSVVEQEPNPEEMSPEVAAYLEKVEDHSSEKSPVVVIADGTAEKPNITYPNRPVIVLPITPEVEEEGKKKNYKWSIRWLVEWSHRIVKMFAGKVIYRTEKT